MMRIWVLALLISSTAWSFDHDHQLLRDVLQRHVQIAQKQSVVDYQALKKDPAGLFRYLDELSRLAKSEFDGWSREQKLAALINAYNAWTIKLIVDHYPVPSIRKIGPFYSTPWKLKFFEWLGENLSLDELEHERIRNVFSEPRVHFALVCASLGCPSLQAEPFVATDLNSQLDKVMIEFLTDESKNRYVVNKDDVLLSVSSIFKWYGRDFGNEEELKTFLLKGMGIEKKVAGKKVRLSYLEYDWSLNEIK